MNAQSITRPAGTPRQRVSKIAGARDTLAGFGHDTELDVLTFGQFSLIDAIEAVLEITGPADVALATWTAANFDLTQIQHQLQTASIRTLRLLLDRSFVSRKPQFVAEVRRRFGNDSVRTTSTHAKFCVITNPDWRVVMRGSMNLNHNPRLEYLQVVDSPALAEFYLAVVDGIFGEEPAGLDQARTVPDLDHIQGVQPSSAIRMAPAPKAGR